MENLKDRYVVTFKNNDIEQKIKNFLGTKVNATAFIKELVWDYMNNSKQINDFENTKEIYDPKKNKRVGSLKQKTL